MMCGSPVSVPLGLSLHGTSTAFDAKIFLISVFEVCKRNSKIVQMKRIEVFH